MGNQDNTASSSGYFSNLPLQYKQENMDSSPLTMLFTRSVPHILEKIFFSLDYESFVRCSEVNRTWNGLLTSEPYLSAFHRATVEYNNKIRRFANSMAFAMAMLSSRDPLLPQNLEVLESYRPTRPNSTVLPETTGNHCKGLDLTGRNKKKAR